MLGVGCFPFPMLTPLEKVAAIRAALPPEGLFADKDWLLSPEPFLIDAAFAEQLDKLGYRLQLFNRACNELYRLSVAGKQPRVDRRLPRSRQTARTRRTFAPQGIPRRPPARHPPRSRPHGVGPDRLGYVIAELDNIPGGIGLTQWLNETYAALRSRHPRRRARHARRFPPHPRRPRDIVVSEEAATYRPEMQYLGKTRLADCGCGLKSPVQCASSTQSPTTAICNPPRRRRGLEAVG